MDESFLKNTHQYSFQNRVGIERSKIVGCFYCRKIYPAKEINEWIPDKGGDTAECSKCGIDSVIGDVSGIELTKKFLDSMYKMWFGKIPPLSELKEHKL